MALGMRREGVSMPQLRGARGWILGFIWKGSNRLKTYWGESIRHDMEQLHIYRSQRI